MTCTNCLADQGPLCADCEALEHTAKVARHNGLAYMHAFAASRPLVGQDVPDRWTKAAHDLIDPARQAERLRAMLEVRSFATEVVAGAEHVGGPAVIRVRIDSDTEDEYRWIGVSMSRIPALILALLAIPRQAPDARDRTLRALEEAGR